MRKSGLWMEIAAAMSANNIGYFQPVRPNYYPALKKRNQRQARKRARWQGVKVTRPGRDS